MAGNGMANGGLFPRGFSATTRFPWPLVRADELVILNYGKALCEGDRKPGNVPVYGTNGPCGWHDTPIREGPGVILGRKGQGPLGVEWCDTGCRKGWSMLSFVLSFPDSGPVRRQDRTRGRNIAFGRRSSLPTGRKREGTTESQV